MAWLMWPLVVVAALFALPFEHAAAQTYPNGPIKMLVGFAPAEPPTSSRAKSAASWRRRGTSR